MATRNRRKGRAESLAGLIGGNKAAAVAEAEPVGELTAEPVDETWPPAEPVDDQGAPSLTVVPDPRHEQEPDPKPEPEAEAVADPDREVVVVVVEAEPEGAPAEPEAEPEIVEAEVVDVDQEQPEPEDVAPPEPEPQPEVTAEQTTPQAEETAKVIALRTGQESELEVQRKRLLPKLPDMVPPSAELAPHEQLDYYENILSGANRNLGMVVDLAKREYVRYVGWTLRPIRDGELWATDPERTFKDFDAYCQEQWGWSGDYANKQIRALPVINVLRDVTAKELKEGPLRVLVRVYSGHGEQAVLDTWFEAESYGSTSAANLEKAAKALGFIKAGQKDDDSPGSEGSSEDGGDSNGGSDDGPEREPAISPKLTPKQKAETWLRPLADTVATDETKELTATIKETRAVLDRLELQLKERQKEERARVRAAKAAEKEQQADTEPEDAEAPDAEPDSATEPETSQE